MHARGRTGVWAGCAAVVVLHGGAMAYWQGWGMREPVAPAPARAVEPSQVPAMPVADLQRSRPDVAQPTPMQTRYAQLRAQIRWEQARIGPEEHRTPDLASRLLLARSAAREARLHEVGLKFEDVYGLIEAESSWVSRNGASRDGTPNLGIAQFEPATAAAVGLRDPHDMVEAVHAAARHMREAAQWSRQRIAGLQLDAPQRAARLREGVSVYYNLSSKGRARWNGRNTAHLPIETRRHIQNARHGAQQAAFVAAALRTAPPRGAARATQLADAAALQYR